MAEKVGEGGSVMDQMLKLFEPPGGYPPERWVVAWNLFTYSESLSDLVEKILYSNSKHLRKSDTYLLGNIF